MKSLLVATTNAGKLVELKKLLSPPFELTSLDSTAPVVIEDGNTYEQNAEKKARGYFNHYQVPILSDDSGIEVDILGKRPGVDSAIYGGENLSWKQRWDLLYSELKPFPKESWTARFRCILCYFDGGTPRFFEGKVEGFISTSPSGTHGFGYDPIFFSTDLKRGFGDATPEEKDRVSHRARAVLSFKEWALKFNAQ